jgi:hypothetical protein
MLPIPIRLVMSGLNAKIIVPSDSDLENIIGDMAGIVPLVKKQSEILN